MQISEHVERLVNLLKQTETKETMQDGADLHIGADNGDDEDEDSKIEEL